MDVNDQSRLAAVVVETLQSNKIPSHIPQQGLIVRIQRFRIEFLDRDRLQSRKDIRQ